MPLNTNTKNLSVSSKLCETIAHDNFENESENDTNLLVTVVAQRVMEVLSPFSNERRAFAQTCRLLREFDRAHFVLIPGQISVGGQEGGWSTLEQYYARLVPYDLGGAQYLTDNTNPSIDIVRLKYDKIKKRQAFKINHFIKEVFWCLEYPIYPIEYRDLLKEMTLGLYENAEPGLLELEQAHKLLDKINDHLIQVIIDVDPCSETLYIMGSNLTRFPDSVIESNLSYFQALKRLDCHYNKLNVLPESIGQLQSLRSLNCHFNNLEALPASIGQLSELAKLNCRFNKLQGFPESIGQCRSLLRIDCSTNEVEALPESFRQLTKLQELVCWKNPLQALPQGVGGFKLDADPILHSYYRTTYSHASQEGAADTAVYEEQERLRPRKKKR